MLKRLLSSVVFTFAIGLAYAQQLPATIDAVDANSLIVRGHLNSTGQSLEFKIANPALLRQLRPGQRFYANVAVSLDGRVPAGTIFSLAAPSSIGSAGGSNNPGSRSPQPAPPSPSNSNALQQAVQTAANLLAAGGDVIVPPQCNGNVLISCSQGRPVRSNVHLTLNSLKVSPAGANAYTFQALISARTPAAIPVSYGGLGCGLNINTGQSGPVSARGSFNVANLPAPNLYKLTLTGLQVANAQGALQFNGGPECGVANAMQGLVVNTMLPQAIQSRAPNPVCVAVDPRAGAKAVNCPR